MSTMISKAKSIRQKNKSFTLVELLVVVAIIAILMSLLMPVLAKAKKIALNAVCASNQKQLGIAMFSFTADNRNQLIQTTGGGSVSWDGPY